MSRLWIVVASLIVAACFGANPAGTAELRARTSLSVLADVVDPAYQLAMRGCMDRQDAIMRKGEAGDATAAATEAELKIVSKRCARVRAAFDEIRSYHDRAADYVKAGKFDDAQQALEAVRESWRSLREGIDAP